MLEKKIMKNLTNFTQTLFECENQRLNLWLPVAFALGIICYFSLPFEPTLFIPVIAFILSLTGYMVLRLKSNAALLLLFIAFFLGGFIRILIQTDIAAAPFIHKSYSFVSVVGRVEKVEWRQAGIRLTLSELTINKIPEKEKPVRIRVSANGHKIIPKVGDFVALKAKLSPPSLAWYPNGYNFARLAFYQQIGATGFATSRLKVISNNNKTSRLENIRMAVLKRILSILPKDTGNIAVALITGEQGGVSAAIRDNYTGAGIVHVLSVSGFHMSLIAGFIFALLRFIFSLIPAVSLRYNTKKICALLALILTFGYLLISGMAVPAVRSYLMIAFVLIAVILDRQALSMRSVMWAGFLILLISPQVLLTASFALSFGAVIALIAGYESLGQQFKHFFAAKPVWVKWTLGAFCVFIIMNLIAHLATAPIAAYHFHRYNNYGVLGNFLTSTTFSFLIMPLLFIATILMPIGLDRPFISIVGFLLDKINSVTAWINSLPYATIFIPSFPNWGYGLILFGGLWICIWQSKIRYLGFAILMIGTLSLFCHQTPDLIIGQGGKLIAVRQDDSFAFTDLRKQKAFRKAWLEANGIDPTERQHKINNIDSFTVKGFKINPTGKGSGDIIINTSGKACFAQKLCIPRGKLWKEGTHTLFIKKGDIKIETSADGTFNRPWGQGKF